MKKLLSILMVLALVLSLGLVAFAEGEDDEAGETPASPTYTDAGTATVSVYYEDLSDGADSKSPAETFAFSAFTKVSIRENAAASWPNALPTIASATFAEDDATATPGKNVDVTITLPTYTDVGIYTYSFTQTAGTTAGVTYDAKTYYLVVTVVEQDGKVRIAAVHCEGAEATGNPAAVPANNTDKTDKITNTYGSGKLSVKKIVTGNLGDKSKLFDVTVTLTAPEGKTVQSTISVSGGSDAGNTQTIAGGWTTKTISIKLKDNETVDITNIPDGVTWAVAEKDYTGEGYDAATYSAASGDIKAKDADTCDITNNKAATVDTGIALDSLPYILLAVLAFGSAVVLFARRRRSAE